MKNNIDLIPAPSTDGVFFILFCATLYIMIVSQILEKNKYIIFFTFVIVIFFIVFNVWNFVLKNNANVVGITVINNNQIVSLSPNNTVELCNKNNFFRNGYMIVNNPGIIVIKNKKAIWGEVLTNMQISLSTNSSIYVTYDSAKNGRITKRFNDENLFKKEPVYNYDSVVIFIGKRDGVEDKVIKNTISKTQLEAIQNEFKKCK